MLIVIEIFDKATFVQSFWTSVTFVKNPTLSIKDLFYNAFFQINGCIFKDDFPYKYQKLFL